MAEIERREQQNLQLRQEKEKLYQSAVEAYEKFELSTALSKLERVLELERQAPETSASERGASYQSFYNQVRSEQDAMMAAYTEARQYLTDGNFSRAIEISDDILKKYPGQALFQALRFDIEERKRQSLSAFMAEVDKNAAAEPDLDKRFDILRKAAEEFPDESHFERALKLTREKRDLVNSIAAKARGMEEQAQFAEALAQWELLRTVYSQYPGLKSEMDRVTRRRSQQIVDEAKARWTEQIDHQLEAHDYAQASNLLREAQAEFPGDAELEELAKLVHLGEERKAGTQALVDQGRAMVVHGRLEDAATLFRRAYDNDPSDLVVRGQLVDALVQHARTLLDTNWKRSDSLIQSALELDPTHPQARSVSTLVADRKRDDAIDHCINRARQMQATNDVAGALKTVEQMLLLYPTAARLVQLKSTLQTAKPEGGQTGARQDDLEKLTLLEAQAEGVKDAAQHREILARVRELAAKHLDDPEFQNAMIGMEKRYVTMHRTAPPPASAPSDLTTFVRIPTPSTPAPPPPSPAKAAATAESQQSALPFADATSIFRPPVLPKTPEAKPEPSKTAEIKTAEVKAPTIPLPPPKAPEPKPVSPAPVPAATVTYPKTPAQPPPPAPPKKDDAPPTWSGPTPSAPKPTGPPDLSPPAKTNWKVWAAFVAGFAVIATAGIGTMMWRQHSDSKAPAAPVTGSIPVDIRTEPEGATILLNDKESGTSNLQLKLAPGTYRVTAVRDGFQSSQTTVTVSAGHPASANLVLQAMSTTLRLLTDFPSNSILLDGKPQTGLQSGQLILDNVPAGSHVLGIGGGTSATSIRFDARDGAPPVVTELEAAKDSSAILITNVGNRARIYSNQKTGPVTLDGVAAGNLDPAGVELTNVGPGHHEITVGEGDAHRKVVYETARAPALTVYLNSQSQQSAGTMVITTGEDDVHVSLDGKPIRVTTRRGQLRLPNLPPKQYVIAVAKDGFQPVPEQRVTVNKGEESKVVFQMKPIPAISMLHLAGAVPGTQVVVDGKTVGTAGQDGSMPVAQLPPGSHTVILRRDDYKPKTFQLNFGAGKDVTLTGSDVALEPVFGTLNVTVAPAGAQVTIVRSGESQPRIMSGNSIHLPEGSYTITASAPHFTQQSTALDIAAGSTRTVTLNLAPERVAQVPKTMNHIGMSGWQFPAAWTPEGDHFTRKGGNLVLFSPQGPGTYAFNATMKHGKQLRWVAHVINEKNFVEFELDSEYFYRRLVTDGKSKELVKKKHGLSMQGPVSAVVQVSISPAGIVQRIQGPNGWAPLDSWMDPALHDGRFGFMIRGRDEVSLNGFSFTGVE